MRRDADDEPVGEPRLTASPYDVVVVGAGIVGGCCALYAARAGLRVALVERAEPGAGTSSACEGNLLAWDKHPEYELPLARRSHDLWAQLAAELVPDIEHEIKGSVLVAANEEELAVLHQRVAQLIEHGVEAHVLDARELRAEEPAFAKGLPGGALFPGDAQIEPRAATQAIVAAARRAGADLLAGEQVEQVELDSTRRVRGVRASGRVIAARMVVLAAGVWTPALLRGLRARVPILPRKGQIVVTERPGFVVRRKLSEAGYIGAVNADLGETVVSMVVESTRSGQLLLGSSRQDAGISVVADERVSAAIVQRALSFFPGLAHVRAIRSYAGLRPFLPDHRPAIGRLGAHPDVIVATGHEGAGVSLAPGTGELVARIACGEALPPWARALSPDRFLTAAVAA